MSQQVQIDYQQIAVECNSVCEVAESRLKDLAQIISQLDDTSQSLINDETRRLSEQIIADKKNLEKKIQTVRDKAEAQAKQGTVHTNNHDQRYAHMNDAIKAADELKALANSVASRAVEYQSILTSLLKTSLNDSYRKLFKADNSAVIQKELESVKDATLRQFALIALLQDNTLTGESLMLAAKALQNESFESRLERESANISAELEAARIPSETIEKVLSTTADSAQETLAAIRTTATTEIVGEKVRQKSLKIIMQAIKERGFIVDKQSIKIKRDTNEVILIAQKASGEKAEFRVFVDGKFIYDFHGYEGQACQKDIKPFLSDLEEVYGVHITNSQEIWSNPNKIQTMKYQANNTNKNKR